MRVSSRVDPHPTSPWEGEGQIVLVLLTVQQVQPEPWRRRQGLPEGWRCLPEEPSRCPKASC